MVWELNLRPRAWQQNALAVEPTWQGNFLFWLADVMRSFCRIAPCGGDGAQTLYKCIKMVVFCQATTALRVADAPPSPVSPPGRRRVTCCPGRTVDGDPSSPTIHIRDLPPHRLVAGQNFGSQAAAFSGARSSATPAPELLSAGAAPHTPKFVQSCPFASTKCCWERRARQQSCFRAIC